MAALEALRKKCLSLDPLDVISTIGPHAEKFSEEEVAKALGDLETLPAESVEDAVLLMRSVKKTETFMALLPLFPETRQPELLRAHLGRVASLSLAPAPARVRRIAFS